MMPSRTYLLRAAATGDIPELRELFRSTVRNVNARDYTQEEVEDWASCGDSTAHWQKLLSTLYFLVAVDADGRIIGFSAVRNDGYLHSMFVRKDRQRQGVASCLLSEMEDYVSKLGVVQVISEVSITARPFFEKQGYTVEKMQKARANRLELTNFVMKKNIR